ncbi:hypothetical protein H6G81_06880 [Scytonema hofmannii FACHB-248]|uniref:Uncharacterized protein n=1 Tax=Scytonema hofmannii FACHB-248 TaxID=1842502 RepID=A0ABR8GM07_9CYAN|nr:MULTISPECIES: hypothetical protein [Nostocales]MBD2604261.1 hypothetical protein [Scytonema hofmannii FACHB-248]
MNLPVIFDLALGLVFTYLILSLLASEIQELIATVLQWRAEHLKKSVEIFLAGDVEDSENAHVIELANNIYSHPLVKNINQEAKGFLVTLPRRLTWGIGSLYRSVKTARPGGDKDETIFGEKKRSGPSYIPSDIFATTLMETLQLPTMVQTLSKSRLEKFKNAQLAKIEQVLVELKEETKDDETSASFINTMFQQYAETQADFEQISWNFENQKADLNTSVSRLGESLDRYIETFQTDMPKQDLFEKALRKVKFIKKDIFADIEQAILLGGLRPNINEVVETIRKGSGVYHEIQDAVKDKEGAANEGIINAVKTIDLIDKLPKSVVENITILGKRAQSRIQTTEEGIHTLQKEIERTFDSSMDRASGVYKRNAKGVAIMLGLSLAIIANADAFHMISRLSKDSALRETITNNAGQILLRNQNNQAIANPNYQQDQVNNTLIELTKNADGALDNVALPIGWSDVNLNQQIAWTPKKNESFPFLKVLTMIPGWIFSGIAISMGAPFWFDLLGKFVNVRNAGKRP